MYTRVNMGVVRVRAAFVWTSAGHVCALVCVYMFAARTCVHTCMVCLCLRNACVQVCDLCAVPEHVCERYLCRKYTYTCM